MSKEWMEEKKAKKEMNGGGLPRPSCIGAYPQLQQKLLSLICLIN